MARGDGVALLCAILAGLLVLLVFTGCCGNHGDELVPIEEVTTPMCVDSVGQPLPCYQLDTSRGTGRSPP